MTTACSRSNCMACQIERFQCNALNGEKDKGVSSPHDRHALPDPIKEINSDRSNAWVQGVTERIRNVYGPQHNPKKLEFSDKFARGIIGHAEQINTELSRANASYRLKKKQITSTEYECCLVRLNSALNQLHKTALAVSKEAKVIDWKAQGVDAKKTVLYFPVIEKMVQLVK